MKIIEKRESMRPKGHIGDLICASFRKLISLRRGTRRWMVAVNLFNMMLIHEIHVFELLIETNL